ncbi:hypothetical protein LMG19089_01400 [Ralstonia edaphis]|uniref:hypothetical protein n=1 Tax=Ralstonia edaphi TaxID=3058599 RepID=UPI0028F645F0|nr:hypothetical protein [Ralstonia sp. LMG 6871]CAJ0694774.1 hypothetical protein LMG19089_01400 [Ralstonia sp. LMG 6871]
MKAWGKGFTGIAFACALSACGGGGDSSNGGFADPNSFSVSATVGGTKVQTFSAGSGQNATLTVKSGQDLRLDSSTDVNWKSGDATSNTEVSVKGASTQSWTAGLKSPPGGTFTVTVTSAKDASKSAKVTVTVTPHEYSAVAQHVGSTVVWSENSTRLDGSVSTRTRTNVTTAVANGQSTVDSTVDAAATPSERYTYDADNNRLTRTYLNINSGGDNACSYGPVRKMLNFPMSVGKSWQTTWFYSCAAGYHESAALTSTVEGYESLTTPAGTFNTLRVHYVLALTNANDSALPGGSTGTAAYGQDYRCWWHVDTGHFVRCDFAYSYPSGAPSNFLKTFSQVATSVQ